MIRPGPPLAALTACVVVSMAGSLSTAPVQAQQNLHAEHSQIRMACLPHQISVESRTSPRDARALWSASVQARHGVAYSHWSASADRGEFYLPAGQGPAFIASARPCRSMRQLLHP